MRPWDADDNQLAGSCDKIFRNQALGYWYETADRFLHHNG